MKHLRKVICFAVCFALIVTGLYISPMHVDALEDETTEIETVCEHDWGDWSVTSEATYETEGEKTRVCNLCGASETATIERLVEIVEPEPTPQPESEDTEPVPQVPEVTPDETPIQEEIPATIPDEEPVEEAEEQLVLSETTAPKTTIYVSLINNGFTGTATVSIVDSDNNVITSKNITGSTTIMRIPTGTSGSIICELSGGNAEYTTQSLYRLFGNFTNSSYAISIKLDYVAPCTHANTQDIILKEATFKKTGMSQTICSDCGEVLGFNTIPVKTCTHVNTTSTITKEATESETGVETVKCNDCGVVVATNTIPRKPHTHKFTEVRVDATCAKAGYVMNVCRTCGEKEIVSTIPMGAHRWNSGEVTKAATCTETGVRTYTCRDCGTTKTEPIFTLAHDYEEIETVEATCKDEGYTVEKCTMCGDTVRTTIAKTNRHDWSGSYRLAVRATCAQEGVIEKRCPICDKVLDSYNTSKTSHKYTWVVSREATTEAEGLKEYKCSACGDVSESEVIPMITCTHPVTIDGVVNREFAEKIPATCSTHAIGDVICKSCGETIIVDYEKPSSPLNPDNHEGFTSEIVKDSTYTTLGTKKFTCTGCGYSYTESIPFKICDHSKTGYYSIEGEVWIKCELCGTKLRKGEITPAQCQHAAYAKYEVVRKQATPTENGIVDFHCSNCDTVVMTQEVHAYDAYTVTWEDGHTEVIYGWFDPVWAQEVFELTNKYRKDNGLNTLTYNHSLEWASNQRAVEITVFFDHYRPGSTTRKWNTICSQWQYGGENLAAGQRTPEEVMQAWKNSPGHNANLLYGIQSGQTPFKAMSVGVFHRFAFNSSYRPHIPTETLKWSQNFTFYEYH